MDLPVFVTAPVVAAMIGYDTVATFLGRRRALEDDHGFPLPVSYLASPLKWRREHVAHWLRRQEEEAEAIAACIARPWDAPATPTERQLAVIEGGRA